jgi:hypothetical protein
MTRECTIFGIDDLPIIELRTRVGPFPSAHPQLRDTISRPQPPSLPGKRRSPIRDGESIRSAPSRRSGSDQLSIARTAFPESARFRLSAHWNSTFPAFLAASWLAGVIRYEVDFEARTVVYSGCNAEEYVEAYPAIEI